MGTTQLAVYNRALSAMGERRLASTSESREPRRVLDDHYSDCIEFALEQGMWNFAMRNEALSSAGSAGYMNYSNKFTKPTDFVHLFMASISSTFDPPLTGDFIDQQGNFYANASTLYLIYSSNDASAGGANLTLWTQTFTAYFVQLLAAWTAFRITGSESIAEMCERNAARYLVSALAIDSVPQLPGLRPFNAEARAKPVEGWIGQPIDAAPFHAQLAMMQQVPAQQRPQG